MAIKQTQNETDKTESILSPFICNYIIDPDRFYIFLSHVTRKGCQSIGCLLDEGVKSPCLYETFFHKITILFSFITEYILP